VIGDHLLAERFHGSRCSLLAREFAESDFGEASLAGCRDEVLVGRGKTRVCGDRCGDEDESKGQLHDRLLWRLSTP